MNGQAIGGAPIACAALRALATEHGGPRPAGTAADATARNPAESRTARATRP